MPGPRNSKKIKKQQATKGKSHVQKSALILNEIEQVVLNEHSEVSETIVRTVRETRSLDDISTRTEDIAVPSDISVPHGHQRIEDSTRHRRNAAQPTSSPIPILGDADSTFIVDPGNGPRVKNIEAFLASFFCPPLSVGDKDCMPFARDEVVTVLEAVLPKEVALIVWYNKTRSYERICPACQRLYHLGDPIADPISGELIDMNNPNTPPHVIMEQKMSGICSFPCFFLASFSSHPYSVEVARGAWGLLSDELDPQIRSLLDATDPRTAAIMRYGLAACSPSMTEGPEDRPEDQGLGRVLRLTRRKDLGLGEVLEALAWYDKEMGHDSR